MDRTKYTPQAGNTATTAHNPEETHPLQPRGLWVPIEVLAKFEANQISSQEVLLAAYVESFVNSKRGEGCWASNAYLGKRLNVTPDRAGRHVQRLTHLGVLKHIGWRVNSSGRYRVLVTCWTPEETVAAVRAKLTPGGEGGVGENAGGVTVKTPRGGVGENAVDINEESINKDTRRRPAVGRGGPTGTNGAGVFKKSVDPVIRSLAAKAFAAFKGMVKLYITAKDEPGEIDKWANQFAAFLPKVMETRKSSRKDAWAFFHRVVTDHLANIEDQMQPKVFAAGTICKEFRRLVEAMERRRGEESTAAAPRGRWVDVDLGGGNFTSKWVTDER